MSKAPHLLIEAATQRRKVPGVPRSDRDHRTLSRPTTGDRTTMQPLADRSGVRFRGSDRCMRAHGRRASFPRCGEDRAVHLAGRQSICHPRSASRSRTGRGIAHRRHSPRSWSTAEDGLLFERGNATDLRRQLERLLREDGLRDDAGQRPTRMRTMEDDVGSMRESLPTSAWLRLGRARARAAMRV